MQYVHNNMSSAVIDKFNFLFGEFLDKIINKFPGNKLKSYKRGFSVLKFSSPSTPVNLFMAGCITYKEHIRERNETFFLRNDDINGTLNNSFGGNFGEESGLSNYWEQFTDSTKTAIWDYLQSLYMLGEMVITENPKEFCKFNTLQSKDYKSEIANLSGDNFSIVFLEKINS